MVPLSPRPRHVCYFNNPQVAGRFFDYELSTLDPTTYFGRGSSGPLSQRFRHRRQRKLAALHSATGLDSLYRERDSEYMRFVSDFVDRYQNAELLVMATYNPIHPEILRFDLPNPTKILGFIDDPHSTYARGIPYLWAFDGAFYISPGYNRNHRFDAALNEWGCTQRYWFPLVSRQPAIDDSNEGFFRDRDIDVVYVGRAYGSKINRLIQLKRRFGDRLKVHGQWPFHGYAGWFRGLLGKPIYPYRVTPLTSDERAALYYRAKIGINMHLSDAPSETGNLRTYEVPSHGAMLLSDKAALDAHEQILEPDVEAVYYDDINDAIAKIDYYVAHTEERIAIAKRGLDRTKHEYNHDRVLKEFLDWAVAIPRTKHPTRQAS